MSTPGFTLHITAGPLAGKDLRFEGVKFRVGRTKASTVQIKDPAVSEKHAEILYQDGNWHIRDLGSSNGTQINGIEVTGEFAVFRDGDQIRFGSESMTTVEIAADKAGNTVAAADELTVQQFLEAEYVRLEQDIRDHAARLTSKLRASWQEEKSQLLLNG